MDELEEKRLRKKYRNTKQRMHFKMSKPLEILVGLLVVLIKIFAIFGLLICLLSIMIGLIIWIKPEYSDPICHKLTTIIGYRSFDWKDIVLNEYIPEVKANEGQVIKNNKYELELRIDNKTKNDFYDYTKKLKDQGYFRADDVYYDDETNTYTFIIVLQEDIEVTVTYNEATTEMIIKVINNNVEQIYE